jgi:hypothetical protein
MITVLAFSFTTSRVTTITGCSTVPASATPPTSCISNLNLDITGGSSGTNVECTISSGLGYLIVPTTTATLTYTSATAYSERYRINGDYSLVSTFMATIGYSPKYYYQKGQSPYTTGTMNEWDWVEATCYTPGSFSDAVSTTRLIPIGTSNI